MRKLPWTIFLSLVLLCTVFKTDTSASAALSLNPSSGTYYLGNSFTVRIYVSANENINAVEVNLSYDSSKLSLTSCNAVTSTFELAADSSCPSITVGTVGTYSGNGAEVVQATFKANAVGSATVSVSGRTAMGGTAVSTSGGSAAFNIVQYNPKPSTVEVISASHPDNSEWYKESLLELSWTKQSGVSGFSYVLDQEDDTLPDNVQESSGTGVNLKVNEDGVWYFHIKAYNAGGWGLVTHFKIQVDISSPYFVQALSFHDKGDLQPEITFQAQDDLSGIDHYEVRIGGEDAIEAQSPYKSPIMLPGDYTFVISAYDTAGNSVEEELAISVGQLQPPQITELIVEDIFVGTVKYRLIVRGTAPADAKVILQIQSDPLVGEVTADNEGLWEYIYEGALGLGEHKIKAMTEIGDVSSSFTSDYSFVVDQKDDLSNLPSTGGMKKAYLLFFLGGILLGALIPGGIVLYIYQRKYKRRIKHDKADNSSSSVFPTRYEKSSS